MNSACLPFHNVFKEINKYIPSLLQHMKDHHWFFWTLTAQILSIDWLGRWMEHINGQHSLVLSNIFI